MPLLLSCPAGDTERSCVQVPLALSSYTQVAALPSALGAARGSSPAHWKGQLLTAQLGLGSHKPPQNQSLPLMSHS